MHDGTGSQRPVVPGDGWVEVDLPFPGVRQFEDEFAPNLATDGLFIPTPDPLPPSTVVRFHVTLPDDFVLLEGTGVVVWARERGDPSGAPPGMCLRFATLSQHYQDLLDRIVQTHVERGGTPFEVEPRVEAVDAAPGAESAQSPAARGVASERPRLTVRRVGGPDSMTSYERPEDSETAHVPGLVGPLDRTVSLPQPGTGASHDGDGASEADAMPRTPPPPSEVVLAPPEEEEQPPAVSWPPWEVAVPGGPRDQVTDPADLPSSTTDDLASQDGGRPAPDLAETGRGRGATAIRDELFSDDPDVDGSPLPDTAAGDLAPASPSEKSPLDAQRPRRRWSMGRTIATLAAAFVVVGVVAVLVLSPWSRLVESNADEARAVAATGDREPATQAAGQPEEPVQGVVVRDTEESAPSIVEPRVPHDAAEGTGTAADAPPPPPVSDRPATRIESISWQEVNGATRVTLRGDGVLPPDRVAVIPMESPPRLLIRIRRIETRYESYVLTVGTRSVTAIRTGLHPELTPPALYVVCDLAGDGVRVIDSAFDGNTMTVTLGG